MSKAVPFRHSIVYTEREAAALIHPEMNHRTLARWRITGEGPTYLKLGHRIGYRDIDIETFKQQCTRQSTSEAK